MIDKSQVVFGIRAVIEAIESGKQVDKVLMKKDLGGELARELLSVTREYNVPVQRVPVERINKVTRKNHQGVIAFMAAVDYYHVDDIVPALYDEGINPLVVVLDGVTDVRNFGAIARTCECAGVNCIVIPERNSVSVNADAVKTSAGALNYLPVCRERNLVKAVQYLRDSGFKVMGASEKTELQRTECVPHEFRAKEPHIRCKEHRGQTGGTASHSKKLRRLGNSLHAKPPHDHGSGKVSERKQYHSP